MRAKPETWRAAFAFVAVAAVGATLLWQLTRGLSAFTSESWRRASIVTSPRSLPAVELQDQRGQRFDIRDLCGKPVLVDFVYTRCTTVCRALGGTSAQLATSLSDLIDTGKVTVLSVSFDPANDTPGQLARFKLVMDPGSSGWRLARPLTDEGRDALLQTFGVVVIPDRLGGFEHNAALHVVDGSCRVARVFDLGDSGDAERLVRSIL